MSGAGSAAEELPTDDAARDDAGSGAIVKPERFTTSAEQIGRYTLLGELASGGMATVHFARFSGEAGFTRSVVVKRLHPQFAKDPDFVCMFLDEARLASRVRHPHVVSVLDVAASRGELLLCMEYVPGLSLSQAMKLLSPQPFPLTIAASIVGGMLHGLHAAHEATTDRGLPLHIVHRDVSPQNVMLGDDGVTRVLDFGIASAAARLQTTDEGQVKGKLSYMAPEQIRAQPFDRGVDIFASGIVLWELLTGRRFAEGPPESRIHFILEGNYPLPSSLRPGLAPEVDAVVMRALAARPADRFATAEEMAAALYEAIRPAHAFEVASWLRGLAGPLLIERARLVAAREAAGQAFPPARPHASGTEPSPAMPRLGAILPSVDDAPTQTEDSSVRVIAQEPVVGGSSTLPVQASSVRSRWQSTPARFILGGVLGLLVVGAVLLGRSASRGADGHAPSEETTRALPSAGPQLPDSHVQPPAPSPVLPLEAEPARSVPARSVPTSSDQVAAAPPRSAPRVAAMKRQVVNARPKVDPCEPPYVIEEGHKRYKPECL